MKREKLIILMILLTITLFIGVKSQGHENVTFIQKMLTAKPSSYPEDQFWEKFGVIEDNTLLYYSTINDLRIYFQDSSTITVCWGQLSETLSTNSLENYIINVYWRPGYSGFVYSKFEEDEDGGDIGSCSMYYVDIKKIGRKLELTETPLLLRVFDTDLAWSNDGKYFAYTNGISVKIREFESKKEWATTKIVLENGRALYPGVYILGVSWIEEDQKLYLLYKEMPSLEQTHSVEINIEQFGLE